MKTYRILKYIKLKANIRQKIYVYMLKYVLSVHCIHCLMLLLTYVTEISIGKLRILDKLVGCVRL